MDEASVLLQRDGAVAYIVFNRPSALNAVNLEMAQRLAAIAGQLERDESVRCVVLKGAGAHFMAGGDIREFQSLFALPSGEQQARFMAPVKAVEDAVTGIIRMPKPVLASIRGSAAGFGFSLVCACDLAIAADNATFMLSYCQLGTSPDGGGTFTLPRLLGTRRAMGLAMLGDRLNAFQALDVGLVRVVDIEALDAETGMIANRLASQPTLALARTKRLLSQSINNELQVQLDAEAESFVTLASSSDFIEGVNAFVEKRTPRFKGC